MAGGHTLLFTLLGRERVSPAFNKAASASDRLHDRLTSLGSGMVKLGKFSAVATAGTGAVAGGLGAVAVAGAGAVTMGAAAAQGFAVLSAVTSGVGEAMSAVASGDAAKMQEALKGLSPEARKFVMASQPISKELGTIRRAMQDAAFPGFTSAMQRLATNYMPLVRKTGVQTAGMFGQLADQASRAMSTPAFKADMGKIAATNTRLLGLMGRSLGNLGQFFRHLLVLGGPVAEWMGQKMVSATAGMAQGLENLRANLPAIRSGLAGLAAQAGPVFTRVGQVATQSFMHLRTVVSQVFTSLRTQMAGINFSGAFTSIRIAVMQAVPAFFAFQSTLRQAFTSIIVQVIPALARLGVFIATTVLPVVSQFAAFIGGQVVPTLARFAGFIVGTVVPAVLRIVIAVGQRLAPIITAAAQVIRAHIIPALSSLWAKINGQVIPVVQRFISVALRVVGPVVTFAAAVLGRLIPPLLRLAGPVLGGVIRAIGTVIGWVFRVIGVVVNFGSATARTAGAVGGAISRIVGFFARLVSGAVSGINSLISTVSSIPGRILGALGNLGGLLFNAGQQIIQGLINGIGSKAGALASKVSSVVGTVAKYLPGSPVKKGPLRILNNGYTGGQIVKMLAKGITLRSGKLDTAVKGLAKRITSRLGALRGVVAARQGQARDLAGQISSGILGSSTIPGATTAAQVRNNLGRQLQRTKAFRGDLANLQARGLNRGLLRQLAEGGLDEGAATAAGLRRANTTDLRRINLLQTELQKQAGALGRQTANALFGPGIRQAQQQVAQFAITVNVPPTANEAEVGARVVAAIKAYEKRSGRRWRTA